MFEIASTRVKPDAARACRESAGFYRIVLLRALRCRERMIDGLVEEGDWGMRLFLIELGRERAETSIRAAAVWGGRLATGGGERFFRSIRLQTRN
jgi:hypothetical protein